MTPGEFLREIVRPNVALFHEEYSNPRLAFNAIAAVDSLTAHIYNWCVHNSINEVACIKDDSEYRAILAGLCPSLGLLRDIAKAQKHVRLTRGNPGVERADQITVRTVGWGEGRFGHGRWGGPPQVVIETNSGMLEYVENTLDDALKFIEAEMQRLGIS